MLALVSVFFVVFFVKLALVSKMLALVSVFFVFLQPKKKVQKIKKKMHKIVIMA